MNLKEKDIITFLYKPTKKTKMFHLGKRLETMFKKGKPLYMKNSHDIYPKEMRIWVTNCSSKTFL